MNSNKIEQIAGYDVEYEVESYGYQSPDGNPYDSEETSVIIYNVNGVEVDFLSTSFSTFIEQLVIQHEYASREDWLEERGDV